MRIGIDVGGTNTDAVLMDGARVVHEVKTPTTAEVTGGVGTALARLSEAPDHRTDRIDAVMIGTTHFVNALVERRGLTPTAAVRLGLPATRALPPMTDWPPGLRTAVGGCTYTCPGGHEYDGRPLAALDRAELERICADIAAKGIGSVAVSSVFSPVNQECETQAAELIGGLLPHVHVSLSHEIGRVGLLERENATIVNGCLRDLADAAADGFTAALERAGIRAPLYVSQNDGTLMSLDQMRRYPVTTFASGPTNSMRGAAFLAGLEDCVVVDVGGTTTDVGVLARGFPREAAAEVDVAGVRTNFRMPDVLSVGIGGGSLVQGCGPELRVGPRSVGYRLAAESLVFGGATLTATDVAVAAGLAAIGDPALVSSLDRGLVRAAVEQIADRVADAMDRVRVSPRPLPAVLVGGGSVLLADGHLGTDAVHRPPHFAVANAIGASIAEIGGEVDRVFSLGAASREQVLEQARAEAVDRALAAGARPGSVRLVELDETPLPYLPGNAVRVRCKAVGDLAATAPTGGPTGQEAGVERA